MRIIVNDDNSLIDIPYEHCSIEVFEGCLKIYTVMNNQPICVYVKDPKKVYQGIIYAYEKFWNKIVIEGDRIV